MMTFNKRALATATAAIALSVAGGAAVVNATDPDDAQQAREFATALDSRVTSTPVSTPSARLTALEVFRRDERSADEVPTELVTAEARSRGAQPSGARKLLDRDEESVYALPVHDGVCLTSSSYVVQMCLPDAVIAPNAGVDALQGLQAVVCSPYMDPSRLVLYGLVANGVRDLRFVDSNGSSTAVPVENNFAYYALRKGDVQPVSATWQNSTGETFSGALPLPTDAGSTDCDASKSPSQAVAAAKRQALAQTAPAD